VDVGANQPYDLSLTAALYELGWSGILVEADPDLADELRVARPRDAVVETIASNTEGALDFFRVPGTGLGTLDPAEAESARRRGFTVERTSIRAQRLDAILETSLEPGADIHAMSIDVEGAEAVVIEGIDFVRFRPWVLCVEAVAPGSSTATHQAWEPSLLAHDYRFVAFDGVNRWYVAQEHADQPVGSDAGAPSGTSLADAIATPFHALDIGEYGWSTEELSHLRQVSQRGTSRQAWQRELIFHDKASEVTREEYERQIDELRTALVAVEGSRTFAMSRSLARVGKKGIAAAQLLRSRVPRPVNDRVIRERHLRHVTVNMGHLTDPAFLGQPPADDVSWFSDRPRPPIPPGLDHATPADTEAIRRWLGEHRWDSDEQLDSRMDNVGDEVGRTRRALRSRVRLSGGLVGQPRSASGRIAFDARCLQTPAFGHRGIGRFAAAALAAVRESAGDENVTLIIDPGLNELPEELVGGCAQVNRIRSTEVEMFGALIQPSPMTHDPDPIVPLLLAGVASMAIVFDFIPLHYPTVYLKHVADRAEYAARMDALRYYSDYACISQVVEQELREILSDSGSARSTVAWPRHVHEASREEAKAPPRSFGGPIVVMTGDEQRKNTFGGLAGIAAATSSKADRKVVVVGMAGQNDRVHHWSIAAAMRPGEATTAGRLTDEELHELLANSSCVVVPSFDEGLSLPVIEAARAGAPLMVSDIPSHRELVGSHSGVCDPRSPRSIARAVARVQGNSTLARRQSRTLAGHRHEILEDVVAAFVDSHLASHDDVPAVRRNVERERLSVGVATPWVPQRSGIADYSATIFTELAKDVDVTVYTTSDAVVDRSSGIRQASIEDVFEDPESVAAAHDVFITVIGNSHFHLPFVQVQEVIESVAIAHDTRMIEFYLALRGPGGVQQLMLRTADLDAPKSITPSLDDQVNDMRLLQNAGLWEVARRSEALVLHTPGARDRIERETGVTPQILPFAHYRSFVPDRPSEVDRTAARARLGVEYPEDVIHLATFGYVDVRTKLTDVVLEAAGWLSQWGHRVALSVVGSATDQQEAELRERARALGLTDFRVTGFQSEEQFQDWLLAVDLGVQLRVSPLLGVSGPLSDLAAFGTPAVASRGLCVDVEAPEYVYRLPDAISSVTVAEAIEKALSAPIAADEVERQRQEYLERLAPSRYAQRLKGLLEDLHVDGVLGGSR
jgi:FkbM family methyltransferase